MFPNLSTLVELPKYIKYRSAYTQIKELYNITHGLPLPSLTPQEKKEINKLFSIFPQFKINYQWHKFYSYINGFDKRYIPIDFLFCIIIPALNRPLWTNSYVDKNRYSEIFSGVCQPNTYLRRINGDFYIENKIVSPEEAEAVAATITEAIIKPSIESGQGKGVCIFSGIDRPKNTILKYFDSLGTDFIIQEKIKSHPTLSQLNPSSLNTVRLITYRKGSEVFVLSSTMKIGSIGSIVDNGHNGGVFCGIKDGKIQEKIYSLNPFYQTDLLPNGLKTRDISIPNYDLVVKTAKELASQLPYSRYAGWDLSINNENNPVLIEVNLGCPGGNIMQVPNGPLFGELTDVIFNDVAHIINRR